MSHFYKVTLSFDRLEEEDRKRISSETSWDDLWTDSAQYKEEFEAKTEASFSGATSCAVNLQGLPEILPMFGWFDLLDKTELALTNIGWMVISNRFVEAIKSTGFNDFRLIPIRVIDRSLFPNLDVNIRLFEQDRNVTDVRHKDDWFYGFQILEHISVLADDARPVKRDYRLRLDIDSLELPPFFREKKSPGELLVSEVGKKALEDAGIRGIRFVEPFV